MEVLIIDKEEILNILYGKETWEVYYKFQQLENETLNSNELYQYFDLIKNMLFDEKTYIRVRGFRLICKLSKWDNKNKINNISNELLNLLYDDMPTAIRQCLKALSQLIIYKPELIIMIKDKLEKIDCLKFKDSMRPLIKKDIEYLLSCICKKM